MCCNMCSCSCCLLNLNHPICLWRDSDPKSNVLTPTSHNGCPSSKPIRTKYWSQVALKFDISTLCWYKKALWHLQPNLFVLTISTKWNSFASSMGTKKFVAMQCVQNYAYGLDCHGTTCNTKLWLWKCEQAQWELWLRMWTWKNVKLWLKCK